MKFSKKIFSIIMCVALVMQFGSVFAAAESADYTIVSPYADVVWSGENAWGAYKGSLHSHTTYSDADDTLTVMVKESYRQGYDFLAISDHGITGVDWDEAPYFHPLYIYQFLIDNPFEHLTTEEYEAIKNGTYDDRGYGMTPVLGANEFNNLSLTKNHVNGHFLDADEGNAFPGAENERGYDQALKYIDEHDGLSYINHPGDWLQSNDNPDAVNNPENVEFFGNLILKYDSCLGTEVFNERNGTTGYDRILWDNLLMYCLPYGKNVIGFSNSDAHHTGTVDSSFSVFMMEENTSENIEKTMQTGAFFGITRILRGNKFDIGPAEGFDVMNTDLPYPMFTSLTVNGHTVDVSAKDCTAVKWIANGKIIAESTAYDSNTNIDFTLNLDEIEGAENFQYIRAELYGEGGMCVSQALVIDDGSEPLEYSEETGIQVFFNNLYLWFKSTKLWTIFSEVFRMI